MLGMHFLLLRNASGQHLVALLRNICRTSAAGVKGIRKGLGSTMHKLWLLSMHLVADRRIDLDKRSTSGLFLDLLSMHLVADRCFLDFWSRGPV